MINGELVIEWKKEKSIQCEDFDEDTGEKVPGRDIWCAE